MGKDEMKENGWDTGNQEMSENNSEDEKDISLSAEQRAPDADEITKLIEEKKYSALRREMELIPSVALAERFSEVPKEYHPLLFRMLPKELAAETFVELDTDTQLDLIKGFSEGELSAVLEEMYLDDTVDIIEEMPASVVKKILRASRPEDRNEINKLLNYEQDTAGSIMTTEYVRFLPDMTVGEALAHIRKVAIDKETIYTCYITDKMRHLIGIVTAKSLLISDESTPLEEIMEDNVIFASTSDDKETVALTFDKYGFIALPVVDSERRLVGIITVDDAIDVIREETEEDIAKMAGITPTESSYIKTSVLSIWRSRIPWLMLLMISATFSSTILNSFESMLPSVLILFVPMLMDTGGNSGGQASVTVIRSLSLGEVTYGDVLLVLWKELRVGIMAGVALGAVAFGKVMLVDRLIMQNDAVTAYVALAVSVSLCLTIMLSKLIGALLPIGAKRIGLDPAVMASPFVTTVVDAASLLIYFAISAYGFGLAA